MTTRSKLVSIVSKALLIGAAIAVISKPAHAEEVQAHKIGVGYKIRELVSDSRAATWSSGWCLTSSSTSRRATPRWAA